MDLTKIFEVDEFDLHMSRKEAEEAFAENTSSIVGVVGTYLKEKNTIVIVAVCEKPTKRNLKKRANTPGWPYTPQKVQQLKRLLETDELKDLSQLEFFKNFKNMNQLKDSKPSNLKGKGRKEKKNEEKKRYYLAVKDDDNDDDDDDDYV